MNESLFSILSSELFSTPWSMYIDSRFVEGKKSRLPAICASCSTLDCLSTNNAKVCSKGVTYKTIPVHGSVIVIPGLKNSNSLKSSSYQRLDYTAFNHWHNSLLRISESLFRDHDKIKSETLHYFHDPVKWAEQIKISSEKLISNASGGVTFKEKFDCSSNEIKSIYQSSRMLTDSIQMVEVFFNPESASYGGKIKANIYRLFDKIKSILFFSEGKKFNKKFKMTGSCYKEIEVYESFSIIAFALTHNALKYSKTNDIYIEVEEGVDSVDVKVTSFGPTITKEEQELIFSKGYRGRYASRLHHDGSGIGLYVSQCIAEIHKFKINVKSEPQNYSQDGLDIAKNSFYFKLRF